MPESKQPTEVQWVCVCCFIALVNGESCHCEDADGTQHPQGLMGEMSDCEPTPGMLREHHAEDCDPYGDCDCEEIPFSHSPCDGCGSRLYGERYAVTGWV